MQLMQLYLFRTWFDKALLSLSKSSDETTKEALIKSVSYGSIHFPFVPSAAFTRCIEGANGKHSPQTE
jgi:hypothetical protein